MRNFEIYSDSDKVVYSRDCYAPVTLTIEFAGLPGAKPTAEQVAQISRLQGRLNIEMNRGRFDYVTNSYPNDWENCTHRAALYLKFLTKMAEKSGWQHQFACEAWFAAATPATLPPAYQGQLPGLVDLGLATPTGSLTAEGWAALASQPLAVEAPTRRAVKWRRGRYDMRAENSGRTGFTGNRRRGVC